MSDSNDKNALVIDGKVYRVVKGGNKRCEDWCALYVKCKLEWARRGHQPCLMFDPSGNSVLMYACDLNDLIDPTI